jgi:hypothetical protein
VNVLRLTGERVLPEDFASFKRHFAHGRPVRQLVLPH